MILSNETMRRVAPAAFAEDAHPKMSDRYGFVATPLVIGALAEAGYHPIAIQQDKAKFRDPGFVQHMVKLRHENDLAILDGQVPEILLTNSHNGKTKTVLRAGWYRFACCNGLVIGHDNFKIDIQHRRQAESLAIKFASDLTNGLDRVRMYMDEWNNITLSQAQCERFATEAAALRFGEKFGAYQPRSILEAHRVEDHGNSLWKVFNVVQENLTKGGMTGENANGRQVRARGITAIHTNLAFNEKLWNLAEAFA